MKTYFYTANQTRCGSLCNYQTCSRRCLALLEDQNIVENLTVLPSGSNFKTPSSMQLRSGDVIILFAENDGEIKALVDLKDFFEPFRIILIVGENEMTHYGRHFLLHPRYTTQIGESMEEIKAVIEKIAGMSAKQHDSIIQQECNHA